MMSNAKPTNPKDAIGIKKVPMSCLSSHVVALVAKAIVAEDLADLVGKEVRFSAHFNAAIYRAMCFWEGTDDELDPCQWARMMAHIFIIRAAQLNGKLLDDRGRVGGIQVTELNVKAAEIIEKYPECKDPFTELPVGTIGQQIVVDIDAAPLDVLPWRVVMEMALGMMEGGRKYGRHNFRKAGVRASVYYDATTRHLADAFEGTETDKDSGLPHLVKALSSSHVLLDSMVMGNWVDDRPIRILPIIDDELFVPDTGPVEDTGLAEGRVIISAWKRSDRYRTGNLLPGEPTCPDWQPFARDSEAEDVHKRYGTCPTCGFQATGCPGPLCRTCDNIEVCNGVNREGTPIRRCAEWRLKDYES